jgi:hypothetical protein
MGYNHAIRRNEIIKEDMVWALHFTADIKIFMKEENTRAI